MPRIKELEDSDSDSDQGPVRYKDLHSIDIDSTEFLSIPADMRHDILTELKETRKENSWAKLHLMPEVINHEFYGIMILHNFIVCLQNYIPGGWRVF